MKKIYGITAVVALGIVIYSATYFETSQDAYWTNSVAEFFGNLSLYGLIVYLVVKILEDIWGE